MNPELKVSRQDSIKRKAAENNTYQSTTVLMDNTGQIHPAGSHAIVSQATRFRLPDFMHDRVNAILKV